MNQWVPSWQVSICQLENGNDNSSDIWENGGFGKRDAPKLVRNQSIFEVQPKIYKPMYRTAQTRWVELKLEILSYVYSTTTLNSSCTFSDSNRRK